MKKILLTLMALATLSGVASAQVSGMELGYCSGELGTNPAGFVSTTKNDAVSAAIYVPADQVAVYAGNHIDEIHVGLASKLNIEEVTVWLRLGSLDGDNVAEATVDKDALVKGWNTVALAEPYAITAETGGLYIGYTYRQKSTSKALAVVGLPQQNALLVKLGAEADWADRSGEGTLSLEAMVYGDALPQVNLSLVGLTTQDVFVVDKGTLSVTAQLRNVASQTITAFDAQCRISGADDVYTVRLEQPISYGELATVEFTIEPACITRDDPATRQLTVTICNLAEGDDEAPGDNTLATEFQVVMHDFTRVPLVEEFTTEKCTNCPRVAAYLHEAAADERFAGRFNTVEHHSGYYTDGLTIQADQQWEWFFDNVYAPAIMLDRAPEYGDSEPTSVFCPSSQAIFNARLQNELLKPAFVSLKITAELSDDASELHVTVTGERSKPDLTVNPARITVMLTEDSLVTYNQAGYSGAYTHVNVGRRVNAIWGDVLEWDADQYTYECTLSVSSMYVREHLGVLAFIHDADEADKLGWEVCNSAFATWQQLFGGTDGIASRYAGAAPQARRGTYNMQGQRVTPTAHGLYIENGRKVIR